MKVANRKATAKKAPSEPLTNAMNVAKDADSHEDLIPRITTHQKKEVKTRESQGTLVCRCAGVATPAKPVWDFEEKKKKKKKADF